ncbi:tyramine oxidase [Pseudoroseomonas deserti]|uniref:Amine oxidase n=1 Tax=Teichococcus deserti TaxID=1817963 RepID=A0A1V2H4M9_9PROT|nr:primary-amine oxidase [Pseudoroseomonas deserti]ONG55981.1 tyramine oxidase [Pseudoroseomonas deserti]
MHDLSVCGCARASTPAAASCHPLDPLTPAELMRVVAVLRAAPEFGDGVLFETIELKDPDRAALRGFEAGGPPPPRQARAALFRAGAPGVWRLVVDLDAAAVVDRKHLPDARPMIQIEQFFGIEDLVRQDPRFIAACARRGITDMQKVCVDPWSAGNFGIPGEEGRLLCHTFAWLRLRPHENFYAHPIEGLNAVVDLMSGTVIRVDDHGVVPVPMAEHNYDRDFLEAPRQPYKPLDVVQPEGVSFRLEGRQLSWDRWSLRIGFNAREALTLHDIRYDGRPVLHRASLVEMVVPYGSPENGHARKNVFDVGEYGLGKLTNSLKLGCDCLGEIQYLDAHLGTMQGGVMTIGNAICIHEEDAGLLWKHWDFRSNRAEVRRARRLVVSCICTVGNYEYALYWYLHTDGGIQFEVKATGIVNTAACLPGNPGKYAREVAPGVAAQIHQHIFCARLEMAVDGDRNSLVECNTEAEPEGPANPYGNAFFETETLLPTERAARRRVAPESHRYWKVCSSDKTNAVGRPTAYKLEPLHAVTPMVSPCSPSGRRARFTQNHLWASPLHPEERYPAGEYMNHSDGADDIWAITEQDRPITDTALVLWHCFGLHHPVRPEDFPVQPCISTGFRLTPSGFFDRNPGIDLAPSVNAASCHACAGG